MSTCCICKKEFTPPDLLLIGSPQHCRACRVQLATARGRSMEEATCNSILLKSGVDSHFLRIKEGTTRSPLVTRVYSLTAEAFSKDKPLFLYGGVMLGKTLTLTYFARTLVKYGVSISYQHVGRLADRCRLDPVKALILSQHLQRVDHLFLDDLLSDQDKSGWFTAWLTSIIDYRYSNDKPTSGSSNAYTEINKRIARRIMEPAIVKELK